MTNLLNNEATEIVFSFALAECRVLDENGSQSLHFVEARGILAGSETERVFNQALELKADL